MTERQLNMLQSAQDGIQAAREELQGPGAFNHMMTTLRDELFTENYRPMTVAKAAYLACFVIAWQDAGSPDLTD